MMTTPKLILLGLSAGVSLAFPGVTTIRAAPVIGGPQAFTVRADQKVTLAPGTAFNPGTSELPVGTVSATTPTLTFDRMI